MKGVVSIAVAFILLATATAAEAFEPKVALVCVKSRTGSLVVDRGRLVSQLVQVEAKIAPIQLRPDASPVTPEMQALALLDPEGFCRENGCSAEISAKLGSAFVALQEFLNANSGPYGTKYRVAGHISADAYLSAAVGPTIECASQPGQQQAAASSGAPVGEPVRRYFGIRKNVDDFRYSQSDEGFKKLERANLSFKEDYIADSQSFGIEGVAGYTLGPAPIGRAFGQITPFVSYKQDTINKPGATQDQGVYNLGGGLVGDILFPIGRMYQDLQLYPKYVHSFADDSDSLISTIVYTPEPAWPFIGQIRYIVPNALSAQFTPQLKAAYGVVFDAGTNPILLEKGDYFRWGPKIALALYGEKWLRGFQFFLSYEYYDVSNAKIQSLERFEAALNYTIGEKELWALQLKYVNGQDFDTWEDQEQVTLGAGLKY